MKQIFGKLSMAVAALTMFAACDNSMYEYEQLFPDQYKRVVCIKQEAKSSKELFNVGKDDYVDFTILRSGGIPEGEASVNLVPMTQEELSLYSENYVIASSEIFSLSASTLNFESGERFKTVRGTFSAAGIEAASQAIAALEPGQVLCAAFKLEQNGETTIDKEKNYIIRELSVNEPKLNFNFEGTYVNGTSTTLNVELPFANEDFEITWDCDIDAADFTGMEPSTSFGNGLPAKYAAWSNVAPVVEGNSSMGAGETSASYTISLPAGAPAGIYDVQVKFGNAKLNGQKDMLTNYADKGEIYTMYIRFDTRTGYWAYEQSWDDANRTAGGDAVKAAIGKTVLPHSGMKFIPGSSWSTDMSLSMMFDNNTTSCWENTWGNFGWGPTTVPVNSVIDLGSEQTVSALEYWFRDHSSYVYDTKGMEVYAAESADYSDPASIQLDGLRYLGFYEKASGNNNRMGVIEFPEVTTQYIVIRYTSSNRGNSINCCEMRLWN